jgi:hypothetical protein
MERGGEEDRDEDKRRNDETIKKDKRRKREKKRNTFEKSFISLTLLGQVSQAQDHYEETISAGWDIADDVINGYSKLLGVPPSGRFTKPDWTQ